MRRNLLGSLGWQTATLLGKFLLVLALSRDPAHLGAFNLLRANLMLGVLFLGLQFTLYTTREQLRQPEDSTRMLRDQFVVHGLTYIAVLPAFFGFLIWTDKLSWTLLPWFLPLLVLEHLGQELYRYLVVLGRNALASALQFFRQASWIVLVLALNGAGMSLTLERLVGFWVAAEAVTLVAGAYLVRHLDWESAWRTPIDWAWVGRGLRVSARFMSSAIPALLLSQIVDLYFLRPRIDPVEFGVYSFYTQIRDALITIVEAVVLDSFRPRLIQAWQRGQNVEHAQTLRRLLSLGLLALAVAGILAAALLFPLVAVIDQPIYLSQLPTFALVLLSPAVSFVANVLGVCLYARGWDWRYVANYWIGLGVATTCYFVLLPIWGLPGVAVGSLAGYASSVLLSLCWLRLRPSSP